MRVPSTGNFLRNCFIWLFLSTALTTASAQPFRVQVNVTDDGLNFLANANINFNQLKVTADSTGQQVQFLPAGNYKIGASAIGHITVSGTYTISSDTNIYLILPVRQSMLGSVIVTANRRLQSARMSSQSLSIGELRTLPVILGEIDPMKTISLLPGIKSGGEGSAGVYVRGGGPDQNLVLLDGIPVYNPNHLLGFFSVFNGEAIKGIEVIKGGIPAEYGGRLSSVIAVDSRDGNKDSFKLTGGIGLIASRLAAEGPIVKGKSSFMISARRTYIDQVGKLVAKEKIGDNGYYFYDLNGKISYDLNKKNSLSLTFYSGQDEFGYADYDKEGTRRFEAGWGNRIAGISWHQQINSRLKQQLTLVYNDFSLNSQIGFSTNNFLFSSGLKDYQGKNDWTYSAYS
ncbi:MAG: hypothetical protein EOO94_03780, partial [Pedobacter sp.]